MLARRIHAKIMVSVWQVELLLSARVSPDILDNVVKHVRISAEYWHQYLLTNDTRRSVCTKSVSKWWTMCIQRNQWIHLHLSQSLHRTTMRRSWVNKTVKFITIEYLLKVLIHVLVSHAVMVARVGLWMATPISVSVHQDTQVLTAQHVS